MTDWLSNIGALAGLGKDALIEVLGAVIDGLGQGTEFSGDQLARLGELEQKLGDVIRGAAS
jgi:hypothetical protein